MRTHFMYRIKYVLTNKSCNEEDVYNNINYVIKCLLVSTLDMQFSLRVLNRSSYILILQNFISEIFVWQTVFIDSYTHPLLKSNLCTYITVIKIWWLNVSDNLTNVWKMQLFDHRHETNAYTVIVVDVAGIKRWAEMPGTFYQIYSHGIYWWDQCMLIMKLNSTAVLCTRSTWNLDNGQCVNMHLSENRLSIEQNALWLPIFIALYKWFNAQTNLMTNSRCPIINWKGMKIVFSRITYVNDSIRFSYNIDNRLVDINDKWTNEQPILLLEAFYYIYFYQNWFMAFNDRVSIHLTIQQAIEYSRAHSMKPNVCTPFVQHITEECKPIDRIL